MALDTEQLGRALRCIAAWRADAQAPVACPACGKPGLAVADRSARPHAEWYRLHCAACGLDETINIPLGAAAPQLD